MSPRPFTIVCAVDLGEMSLLVIEHALAEAHRHEQVLLHFTTVLEPHKGRFSTKAPSSSDLEEADDTLRSLVLEALPAFSDTNSGRERKLRFHTRSGNPGDEIIELAIEARADTIIVGRHNEAKKARRKPGGVSSAVVDLAPCSVLVVGLPDHGQPASAEQCPACVQTRHDTGGDKWFCPEHSDGRAPRLMRSIGLTSPTPGWGIF